MKSFFVTLLLLASTFALLPVDAAIHTSPINRVYEHYRGKQKVYIAESTGENGLVSIYSPHFAAPHEVRAKALQAFKEGKGTLVDGTKIIAFDEAGNQLEIKSIL